MGEDMDLTSIDSESHIMSNNVILFSISLLPSHPLIGVRLIMHTL